MAFDEGALITVEGIDFFFPPGIKIIQPNNCTLLMIIFLMSYT